MAEKRKRKSARTKLKKRPIWEKRNNTLKTLELHISSLKKSIDDLERKMSEHGLAAYYSQNHDCMRYAESVWRTCLKLAVLKEIDENSEDEK